MMAAAAAKALKKVEGEMFGAENANAFYKRGKIITEFEIEGKISIEGETQILFQSIT